MDLEQRIAQFEHMCREDAENDMAWFSLGGAYNQAARYAEAAEAYEKCFTLNGAMSKAYQLGGAALMAAGDTEKAADVLSKGYVQAAERGDLMPKKAMGELLQQLDKPVPEVEEKARAVELAAGEMVCSQTGRVGNKMAKPPFRGPVGEWIHEHITRETFDDWIGQGTKVINELRLDLSRDEDEATYDRHMREYLGIDDALLAELTAKA